MISYFMSGRRPVRVSDNLLVDEPKTVTDECTEACVTDKRS